MKIFANKKIWKKMIFAIGLIALIGILLPKKVNAGIGGTLINPVVDLFIGLADGVQTLIHKIFNHQDDALYLIVKEGGWIKIIIGIIAGIVLYPAKIANITLKIVSGVISLVLGMTGIGQVNFPEVKTINTNMLIDNSIVLPAITLTPYEIFTSENGVFSVNFFRDEKQDNNKSSEEKKDDKNNTLSLNQNIRDWYKTLRLIAIVGMMSVLVYMGIRILLSSTAESKAKYKQMLWDWIVATFLIFTMQYIMVFANIMVDTITDTLGTIKIETEYTNESNGDTIKTYISKEGVEGYLIGTKLNGDNLEIDNDTSELVKQAYKQLIGDGGQNQDQQVQTQTKFKFYSDPKLTQEVEAKDPESAKILFWPADNFAIQARMNAQLIRRATGNDSTEYIGYALVYVTLTIYTVIFIFVYIKRYIYMVFLTLISPLVALTYPIDKVKDGQAQAFNFWFKEYMYNLLLQPLHLILYMLLIGSAMRFAASDPLYVIVCLGFMVPAEKLLKAMFGFKGQTPGSMPGVATAALMMHATKKLFDKVPKSRGSNGTNESNKEQELQPIQTRTRDLLLGDDGTGGNPGGSPGGSPGGTPGGNPGGSPGGNPGGSPRGSPGGSLGGTPGGSPGGTPGGSPGGNSRRRTSRLPKRAIRNTVRTGGKFVGKVGTGAIRTMAKVGTGVAIGSIGVAAGGLAGLVSGDPSKAFENMLTGGAAGYAVGSKVGDNIGEGVNSLLSSGYERFDDFRFNRNPDKYKEKYNQKFTDEYVKDKEKMRILKRNMYDKEQYRQLKDEGLLEEYHKAGFTDPKEIAAMERYRMEKADGDINKAMSIQKTYEYFYKGMSGAGENSDKFRASLEKKIKKKNPNYSDAQINTAIDNTMSMMKDYDDIKFKIF